MVWQASDLIRYWADSPPLHILVKGLAGFKSADKDKPTQDTDDVARLPSEVMKARGQILSIDQLPSYMRDELADG